MTWQEYYTKLGISSSRLKEMQARFGLDDSTWNSFMNTTFDSDTHQSGFEKALQGFSDFLGPLIYGRDLYNNLKEPTYDPSLSDFGSFAGRYAIVGLLSNIFNKKDTSSQSSTPATIPGTDLPIPEGDLTEATSHVFGTDTSSQSTQSGKQITDWINSVLGGDSSSMSFVAPLISAGLGLGSDLVLQSQANRYNEAQIEKYNQYNTPAAQMERLAAAGLNPNLAYQNINTGNQDSVNSMSPVTASDKINSLFDNANKVTQLKAQNAQISNLDLQNKQIAQQLSLYDLNVSRAKTEISNMIVSMNKMMTETDDNHQKSIIERNILALEQTMKEFDKQHQQARFNWETSGDWARKFKDADKIIDDVLTRIRKYIDEHKGNGIDLGPFRINIG